jgi:high-affinity iron transporter
VAGTLIVVPALAAGIAIAALPASTASASTLTVTATTCGKDFTSARAGAQTFTVTNSSHNSGEINLVNSGGAIVGEIETLGPATSAPLTATLTAGTYTVKCFMNGTATAMTSAPVTVTGSTSAAAGVAVKPVTAADLTPANNQYQAYAAGVLTTMAADVTTLQGDLKGAGPWTPKGLAKARADWLAAQLDWERVGASYDSFGDLGLKVDGLPDGLVNGVNDKDFTGLHRLEYGLWNGQPASELAPVAAQLQKDIATVRTNLSSDDLAGDPTNLPIRAHEILEDALRDHLSGVDDQGAGAAYPMTYADLQVTRVVLGELQPLIAARDPKLLPTIAAQESALGSALLATRTGSQWQTPAQAPLAARQEVDSAIGNLLESLSSVPDLLEVRPA